MKKDSNIYIAGHNGMVGSAILRKLSDLGYVNIITKSKSELDLTNQAEVNKFFETYSPEYVFLCAAKVGGIKANKDFKGDFIYQNMMIQSNIINASKENNVTKLLFLGSSCIYPKMSTQPIKEEYLLTGSLEESNDSGDIGVHFSGFDKKEVASNIVTDAILLSQCDFKLLTKSNVSTFANIATLDLYNFRYTDLEVVYTY